MAWRGPSPYSSAYDAENSCFRRYSELMKYFGNQSIIIQPFDWNEEHKKYQNIALHEYDESSKHFKINHVHDARSSLLNRIEKENKRLIEIYELRQMNEAMKASLSVAKTATSENKEALEQLSHVSEEQDKIVCQNQRRIDELKSNHSTIQQEYATASENMKLLQGNLGALQYQNQQLEAQQNYYLEKCRQDAAKLEELNQKLKQKQASKSLFSYFSNPCYSSSANAENSRVYTRQYEYQQGPASASTPYQYQGYNPSGQNVRQHFPASYEQHGYVESQSNVTNARKYPPTSPNFDNDEKFDLRERADLSNSERGPYADTKDLKSSKTEKHDDKNT